MDDVIINTGEETPDEIETEETPTWLSELLESNRETATLLRDVLSEVRQNNQASSTLVPSLLETNQSLTRQLQEMPAAMMLMITPLLTPPVLEETPLLDTPNPEDEETAPLEVLPEEVVPEAPPERQRPKRRFL